MSSDGPRYDAITWGEGFLRLSPRGRERFEQAGMFGVDVAGGALETAVGLARLGLRTAWLSAVGDTPLGMKLVNKVREHGVDTEHVIRIPDGRTGLCYTETGSAPRSTRSWYDMGDTAFRSICPGTAEWPAAGATAVLHLDLTGPMVDPVHAGRLTAMLKLARAARIRLSILLDVPGGARLDGEIGKPVLDLLEAADVLMVTLRTLETIWGFGGPLASAADKARASFGGKNLAVMTYQCPTAGTGQISGMAISPSGQVFEDVRCRIKAVDADGAAGAFAAGYLLGCQQDDLHSALRYGCAAAALACSVPGPLNWFTRGDLESQIAGTGSGLER